jgi:hypothetical protein
MMVVPLQVGEFVAQGFGLRIVTLPSDFPPFERCFLMFPPKRILTMILYMRCNILISIVKV